MEASQRCGVWGLVATGDTAEPALLAALETAMVTVDYALLGRTATALGEAILTPTVGLIKAMARAFSAARVAAFADGGTLTQLSLSLDLAHVKAERRLATFASKATKTRCLHSSSVRLSPLPTRVSGHLERTAFYHV